MPPIYHRFTAATVKYYYQFAIVMLVGALLVSGYGVVFFVEHDDTFGLYAFGGLGLFLGMTGLYCMSLARNMRAKSEVAYDDDGIWLIAKSKHAGLIRWSDIADVKSEVLVTHLHLVNAAGDVLLVLDSALEDYDALRMQVLRRIAQPQAAASDVLNEHQHVTDAVMHSLPAETFSCPANHYVSIGLCVLSVFMLAMHYYEGMQPLLLLVVLLCCLVGVYSQLTNFTHIVIDDEQLTATNGFGTRSYALHDIAEVCIVDKAHNTSSTESHSPLSAGKQRLSVVRLIFASGRHLDLSGMNAQAIALFRAIERRKHSIAHHA